MEPDFSKLSPEQKQRLAEKMRAVKAASIVRPFYKKATGDPDERVARNKQLPPDHPRHKTPFRHPKTGEIYQCQDPVCLSGERHDDWHIWLILTGRGWGKTETGANWIVDQALKNPGCVVGVAAPTARDLDSVCFRGESGVIAQLGQDEFSEYNISLTKLTLVNGSTIQGFSAAQPERIRGANLLALWIDELAAFDVNRQEVFWAETALPAVRKGSGRIVITTTPKPTSLIRELYARDSKYPRLHITGGSMEENYALSDEALEFLRGYYGNTRRGRQEIYGELLAEYEGALFSRANLMETRAHEIPGTLSRIVVGIDPAMKSGEDSDESGIIVVGMAQMPDGWAHGFILEDATIKGSPAQVVDRAALTFHKWSADCIYYESNQGGDWIPNAFKAYPEIPTREAHSSKGKITRAEPVSGLFERGLCHMVGNYAELEDQLCIMRPNEKSTGHDDRADAMVHAIYGLGLIPRDSWTDAYSQVRCTNCERLYNKNNKSCQHCGTKKEEVIEAPKVINQRNSWAEAYYEVCRKCGAKNAKNKMCPNCNPDFGAYMAQVSKLSGNATSGWGYAGRNWLSGRKI